MATSIDWEQRVRIRPTPAQVAALVLSHGWRAAEERWGWLGHRTLSNMIKATGVDPDSIPDDFEVEDLEP